MEYNTQKEKLFLREYGRNIQLLVQHAIGIKDREERTRVANVIVEIMGHLNPHLKNSDQFKHKIWDHIHAISNFELDVDAPFPIPERELPNSKNEQRIPYPQGRIKHRHYGKNVELMIEKAKVMEDPDKQKAFTEVIGNYMKLVYKNWNRENISDEIIRHDIHELSKGVLSLDEGSNLNALSTSTRKRSRPPTKNQHKNSNYKKRNHKS